MRQKSQSKTIVVSIIAYLIGVPEQYFIENGYLLPSIYDALDENASSRLIRALCQVRTAFEMNFTDLIRELQSDFKHLDDLPQYIPSKALDVLQAHKIQTYQVNWDATQYMMWINKLIANHIGRCKSLFPEWLNWEYIKPLFIMPKGTTRDGVKMGGKRYCEHKKYLPFQQYINWEPREGEGNLLQDDLYFADILYIHHGDHFEHRSYATDADPETKEHVFRFIEHHRNLVVAIDGENADPFKTFGLLAELGKLPSRENIERVFVYSDANASAFWISFGKAAPFEIEHYEIKRVNPEKSRVDMSLALAVKESQLSGADGCLMVSSDSDYTTLTELVPQLDYMFVLEKDKSSFELPVALSENGAQSCWVDDFCTAESYELAKRTVRCLVKEELKNAVSVNLSDIVDSILRACRWYPSTNERATLLETLCREIDIRFNSDGAPEVKLAS